MTKQEFVTKMAAMAVLKEAMKSLDAATEAMDQFAKAHDIVLDDEEESCSCCNECRRGKAFQELVVETSDQTGMPLGIVAEVLKSALSILEEKAEDDGNDD